MRLIVPRVLYLPSICACCLAPADHTIATSLTKTLWLVVVSVERTTTFEVPYCKACGEHVRATTGCRPVVVAFLVLLAASFGSVVFVNAMSFLYRAGGLGETGEGVLAVAFLSPVVAALAYLVWNALRRGAMPGPGHVSYGPAVELVDFSDDDVTLEVRHPEFGRRLQDAQRSAELAFRAEAESPPLPPSGAPESARVVSAGPASPAPSPRTYRPAPKPKPNTRSATVKRRLLDIGADAERHTALRFVAAECRIRDDGVEVTYVDETRRVVSWSDVVGVYARRLPHEPPWDRDLVLDLVARDRIPVRILSITEVNFHALPTGAGPSHLENCRRLAVHATEKSGSVTMDDATETFVRGTGFCAPLQAIEQFLAYDDRYPETAARVTSES